MCPKNHEEHVKRIPKHRQWRGCFDFGRNTWLSQPGAKIASDKFKINVRVPPVWSAKIFAKSNYCSRLAVVFDIDIFEIKRCINCASVLNNLFCFMDGRFFIYLLLTLNLYDMFRKTNAFTFRFGNESNFIKVFYVWFMILFFWYKQLLLVARFLWSFLINSG